MGHHNNRTPQSKQLGEGAGPAHRGRGGGGLEPAFLESSCPQCGSRSWGAIRGQDSGKAGQHLPRLSSLTDPSLDQVFGPKDLLCSGNAFPVPLPSRSASVILPQAFAYTQCSGPRTPFPQASPPSGSYHWAAFWAPTGSWLLGHSSALTPHPAGPMPDSDSVQHRAWSTVGAHRVWNEEVRPWIPGSSSGFE